MLTIEQALDEAYKNAGSNAYFGNGFRAGIEFAQRWIQIDRCTNGYITAHSLSDIERNLPVIMNDEDGIENEEYIVIRYISDLLDTDESFTHWRPINLK